MSLFQRVWGSLAKGYRLAKNNPSPTLGELKRLRKTTADNISADFSPHDSQSQTDAKREFSAIDDMIGRAQRFEDKDAAAKSAEAPPKV